MSQRNSSRVGDQDKAGDLPEKLIALLNNVDEIDGQFFNFCARLDEIDFALCGNDPFPWDDIQSCSTLNYMIVQGYENDQLESMIWTIDDCIRRVDIQTNRVNQIVAWIENKLTKILAHIPPDALQFMDKEEKYHRLARRFKVAQFLMKEREDYRVQQIQWKRVSQNLDRKQKLMWFRLANYNKEK